MSGKEIITKLPTAQLFNSIVKSGIDIGASFIHIEPSSETVIVKYRVDGNLLEADKIPKKRFNGLLDKIKTLANIPPGHNDLIASGKFKFTLNNSTYRLLIYIIPTINGEKVTIKLHSDDVLTLDIKQLGFWGDSLITIQDNLLLKKGLMVISGPGDSGKSTTLATLLNNIETSRNIATLEDPVEYKIKSANQIQINPKTKLTFQSAIKILLKQDIDILMISEIHEKKLASLVIDLAAHKRMVITSIYADSAARTITKLSELDTQTTSLAYLLRLVINQRLLKKLCDKCKVCVPLDKEASSKLNDIFQLNKASHIEYIHQLEKDYLLEHSSNQKESLRLSTKLSTTKSKIKHIYKAKEGGCTECLGRGYKGRLMVFEILKNNQSIENLILGNAKETLINNQAVKNGMISILLDALVKALVGDTTLEEVFHIANNYMVV
ncbi:MAG TPA: ATPase, T2SS/T4P/T4SS family [Candidatus Saccharimonadia bacterium]|nr:ATPase, T2SS/T4P/T4SS family [Candidatus Saccharimonadia bacterium]